MVRKEKERVIVNQKGEGGEMVGMERTELQEWMGHNLRDGGDRT